MIYFLLFIWCLGWLFTLGYFRVFSDLRKQLKQNRIDNGGNPFVVGFLFFLVGFFCWPYFLGSVFSERKDS